MEKNKISILLVEDDTNLGTVVRDYLSMSGYRVDLAADGKAGWDAYSNHHYHICILDIMLPERDGFTLAEMIRKKDPVTPLLFLTAKASREDKHKGFRLGVDDYIVKPFDIEELALRVEVFLRRSQNASSSQNELLIGKYSFDYKNLVLKLDDKRYDLTQKEGDLLKNLCSHMGEIVKRDEILNTVWGDDYYATGRSLDVFIYKLRKYLKDDPGIEIQNFHSVGFKLIVNTTQDSI
jgi:DNA-binding response OmpR family regulator